MDYHKASSYGTIMTQTGQILKQGRFANSPESVEQFLGDYAGKDCSAVLEATHIVRAAMNSDVASEAILDAVFEGGNAAIVQKRDDGG